MRDILSIPGLHMQYKEIGRYGETVETSQTRKEVKTNQSTNVRSDITAYDMRSGGMRNVVKIHRIQLSTLPMEDQSENGR